MQTTEMITSTRWNINPGHSTIGFAVKHLMVSLVKGEFREYAASIYTRGDDFLSIEIDLRINPASISTGDAARDAHLKCIDFFNVDFFKEISFKSSGLEKTGIEMYALHGDLTMKGITRTISLNVDFDGVAKSPRGDKRAYFMVTGNINRKDWGLTWSALIESGAVVVGENISIKCEIELIKQHGDCL